MKKHATHIAIIAPSSSYGLTAGSRDNILYKSITPYYKNTREILRSSRRMTVNEGKKPTINQKPSTAQSAFTLVELAIVIVIIAVLLAGVLQGKELIDNAKINSQVKSLESLKSAYTMFKFKYDCVPGDCNKATNFFTGATNGDGDSQVSISERPQVWMHLNLSKITTFLPHPVACTGFPCIYAKFDQASAQVFWAPLWGYPKSANWILISNFDAGLGAGPPAFTQYETFKIDEKLDDGKPSTGNVLGIDSTPVASPSCYSGSDYLKQNSNPACRLMYYLE
jgi:prepilin-type N-terminal cleavage/methylation domain-containing protein